MLRVLSQSMAESVGSEPQTSFFFFALCSSFDCQCWRVGYCDLGPVAYIARACYMTDTDGVCLSCCLSASTPVIARSVVHYCRARAAVGPPSECSHRVDGSWRHRWGDGAAVYVQTARCFLREVGVGYLGGPELSFVKRPREGFPYQAMLTEPWIHHGR